MKKRYRYIFGPVPSRRFGRSLGIDLTPGKICSQDCIFCQLGKTGVRTIAREEYVPTEEVIEELQDWMCRGGKADYITLSGSGEPTLHSRFGEVLKFIRENSSIPTALLTNGTMLYLPEVRDAASYADVVKVSLSVWNQFSYQWVNRPHPGLMFDQLVDGQITFRDQFDGQIWMEALLIWGINSVPDDVRKIAILAKRLRPDRIQLNTVVRPPAEDFAMALSKEHMENLVNLFDPPAEIIGEFDKKIMNHMQADQKTILSMLQRRPCEAEEIADVFGMHLNEVSKYLGSLLQSSQIFEEQKKQTIYYSAVNRQREQI